MALRPFSLVYGLAARGRVAAYRAGAVRAQRLPGAVISVGNLTVGGTGKTPFVAWLAARLQSEGKRVGILMRGYGGFASRSRGRPAAEPDEVAMLRARLGLCVPVGVGKNRYAAAQPLVAQGIDWFVLDDGFQHLHLVRDADVVLLDATDPFGGGLLPAGRAREPRSALRRADMLVISRAERAPGLESLLQRLSAAPVFYAQTALEGIEPVRGWADAPAAPAAARFFAFCGIGNPSAFEADLQRWAPQLGGAVAGLQAFADHHRYTEDELRRIERAARDAGAGALLCTEKDSFNLPPALPLTLPLFYCRIRLQPADEEGFLRVLREVVARRRGGGR